MDIYTYLHKDHLKVSKLFKEITASNNQSEREELFLEVQMELELHADPERDTFYKALDKRAKGKEDAEHGIKEHKEIKKALKAVRMAKSESEWLINMGKLMHTVEHHVEDEESSMFEDGKKIISEKQAKDLVDEMEAMKEKLRSSKKFLSNFSEEE
ncbi:hemerythrin domain-containing protein [Legionella sp. km772]|uniref:hemerythrin domain-containing protein n=1 Tax=Legionella sp. km772 TaxID=2498111 RepID=UPI000F8DCCFC|nr:hemerythrin domain-containing protein [Legionella sp. km772]RUR04227.1 hemerythrin domain-containing protein [Legionella sp. km772]